ncbi:MAG TPA: hypothetical protein VHN77_12570 [Phycisphaerales bacterium]|nr:hypothetical protein [Phycisphaerales bacterium]
MGNWLTTTCDECGEEVHYRPDWDVPKYCKDCSHIERDCAVCGSTMRIGRDWEHPPKVCKDCKDEFAPKDVRCRLCGHTFTLATGIQIKCKENGWELPTKCHDCKEKYSPKDVDCRSCGRSFTVSASRQIKCQENGWDLPSMCEQCRETLAPKTVECRMCGEDITFSTNFQAKLKAKGWELPTKCQQCKKDSLAFQAAINALRDEFPFAIYVEYEKRGILSREVVAVIRGKRSNDVVAEVKMQEEGIFITERVAVSKDAKTNKEIARTREEKVGFVLKENAAKTQDSRTRKTTHTTKMEKKGVIEPRVVPTTVRTDGTEVSPVRREPLGFWERLFGRR